MKCSTRHRTAQSWSWTFSSFRRTFFSYRKCFFFFRLCLSGKKYRDQLDWKHFVSMHMDWAQISKCTKMKCTTFFTLSMLQSDGPKIPNQNHYSESYNIYVWWSGWFKFKKTTTTTTTKNNNKNDDNKKKSVSIPRNRPGVQLYLIGWAVCLSSHIVSFFHTHSPEWIRKDTHVRTLTRSRSQTHTSIRMFGNRNIACSACNVLHIPWAYRK